MRLRLRSTSRISILVLSGLVSLAALAWITAGHAAAQHRGSGLQEGVPHSAARAWNEATLSAIRNDLARPPVHARNLFHIAVAMYDAWAAYDETAIPYLLGRPAGSAPCAFGGVSAPPDREAAREEAISYAAYRILTHRFTNSPGVLVIIPLLDALLAEQGYDASITTTDYASGIPAALGNYIAACVIEHGLADGANEEENYDYLHYEPVNAPLVLAEPGNPDMEDLNRWQPLTFDLFVDQSGNEFPGGTPKFIGPEWGGVRTFALTDADRTEHVRDGQAWWVYHDPGAPPMIDTTAVGGLSEEYKWGHALVAAWSSHLDPSDGMMWDISPASIGNVPDLPTAFEDYRDFYDFAHGSTPAEGHAINPHTGLPYEPQLVPRGDYLRVLAEFWADGPDSETPPGHWFSLFNYVSDHPLAPRRYQGNGTEMDRLEWDVKGYFALGGAMHDAAIAAWSIKGWYDTSRPISAIRAMAEYGQSTDPALPSYHPAGLPLVPGFVELVYANDPLAGEDGEHVGKIKVYAWLGHEAIEDPEEDVAGVGWMLAENWWPFQRITFVTPPFAGYISGHSTYSRAAAEVLTLLTGDAFFPGGMADFLAPKDVFLEAERGPSVDVTLQWATYRDAASECSLSRIWGGIHPPVDDLPGRLIGETVGVRAFHLADAYFTGQITPTEPAPSELQVRLEIFPNPVRAGNFISVVLDGVREGASVHVFDVLGRRVYATEAEDRHPLRLSTSELAAGTYFVRVAEGSRTVTRSITVLR